LATIYSSDIQKYGTVAKQYVKIERINDIKLGDEMKGWPDRVETLPGEIKIVARFDTNPLNLSRAASYVARL
jgi:hypothetical protein